MTEATQKPFIGLSRKDRARYSVGRCIRSLINHEPIRDGLEFELSQEVERGMPNKTEGIFIPNDVFLLTRDLTAGTFGSAGAFIETQVQGAEMIEILRNKTVCERLGARRLAGLGSNVAIPRHTATVTAYSLPENAALTKSTASVDQVVLTPHRVGCQTVYSRQLALTSSVDVEQFVRDDLLATLNVKCDSLILQGQGAASEPTGILNTTGIGSVVFGGTATWASLTSFEAALASSNADAVPGFRGGWAVSPATRNRWKTIAKNGVGVTSVVPIFLWDTAADYGDMTGDGKVNGYRAACSNQIQNNTVYYGNFSDCIIGMFGQGIDLSAANMVIDPYTQAGNASVVVTLNAFIDVAIRHAVSFCVSSDSGSA